MKEKYLIFFLLLLLVLVSLNFSFFKKSGEFLATLIFPEGITPEQLRAKFDSGTKIRILIVPGHDNDSWGASFKDLKEADLNLMVAQDLLEIMKNDSHFETFLIRDQNGYLSDFVPYFTEQKSLVSEFRNFFKSIFGEGIKKGLIEPVHSNYHATASADASLKLYGINKWANDNKIDIVLHLHFNDYPGRNESRRGIYSGFSIYVPERQLPNSRASLELALPVFKELKKYLTVSNFPQEQKGVVEDQDLIAVGANASLNSAALLIEYGYFYEPQITNPANRPVFMEEVALKTYQGIKNFFEPSSY